MTRLARLRLVIQCTGVAIVIGATLFMAALLATADGEPVTCAPFEIYTVESQSR
jgi:hypothetical protein